MCPQIIDNDDDFLFWFHYVDDIITCVPKNKLDESLATINSICANFQFTSEIENSNVISFLDHEIIKYETGQFGFRVHRKQTHTDKYLNIESYNPINQKESVVRTLLVRANIICDHECKHEEINHVYLVLRQNN